MVLNEGLVLGVPRGPVVAEHLFVCMCVLPLGFLVGYEPPGSEVGYVIHPSHCGVLLFRSY